MGLKIRNTLIVFCLAVTSFFGQNLEEDLASCTYEEIENNLLVSKKDSILYFQHLEMYLSKGKQENNYEKISNAYYNYALLDNEKSNTYLDSIISLENKFSNPYLQANVYYLKGQKLSEENDQTASLENYLKAIKYAKKSKDTLMHHIILLDIAEKKEAIGFKEESLESNLEIFHYMEKDKKLKKSIYHTRSLSAVIQNLLDLKELDSSYAYIQKAFQDSVLKKNPLFYHQLKVNKGRYYFYNENYEKALDTLQNSLDEALNKKEIEAQHLIPNYYYLYLTQHKIQPEKAIENLIKLDKIVSENQKITPTVLKTYTELINYYKSKQNIKKQLEFTSKLLEYDSIYDYNVSCVKNCLNDYDINELKKDKALLLAQNQNSYKFKTLLFSILIASFLIGALIYFFWRKKTQKIKNEFEQKIKESPKKTTEIETNKKKVPEDIRLEILKKLEQFEVSEKFTNKKYTLQTLAKEFKTNSSYLSTVINSEKQCNFSNYINTLRINFATKKLQEDPKFRKYTISAISEECGYSNKKSFSIAFAKIHNMTPSAFIKNLEEKNGE